MGKKLKGKKLKGKKFFKSFSEAIFLLRTSHKTSKRMFTKKLANVWQCWHVMEEKSASRMGGSTFTKHIEQIWQYYGKGATFNNKLERIFHYPLLLLC